MTKQATTAQRKRWELVRALGCIAYIKPAKAHLFGGHVGYCGCPAEIHHCFTQSGGRKQHDLVIPLCSRHHRHQGEGVSFHPFWKTWEKIYGTESVLLSAVAARLGEEVHVKQFKKTGKKLKKPMLERRYA